METESFPTLVLKFLIVAAPFLLVYGFALRAARQRKKKLMAVAAIQQVLDEMKDRITVVTTPGVPGREIERVIGPVTAAEKAYSGYYGAAEKKALLQLMNRAILLGADAVVELRRTSPLRELKGEGAKRLGRIEYIGKAVKLADRLPGDPSPPEKTPAAGA